VGSAPPHRVRHTLPATSPRASSADRGPATLRGKGLSLERWALSPTVLSQRLTLQAQRLRRRRKRLLLLPESSLPRTRRAAGVAYAPARRAGCNSSRWSPAASGGAAALSGSRPSRGGRNRPFAPRSAPPAAP